MNNRILLIITIIMGVVYLSISSSNTTFFSSKPNIKVKDINDNINSMDLENYVIGVVAAEMPASFNEEALKAQAIAARTYAVYKMLNSNKEYDVVTDVSNQSYIDQNAMKEKWLDNYEYYYNKIKECVDETKDIVLTYNNEVIESFYFAMSNGYTEDSSLVFNETLDYITSVPSVYDNNNLKNFEVSTKLTKDKFKNSLNINGDINISNTVRSNTNRVNNITINGKEYKGTEIRKLLKLRSTDFDITMDNDYVYITTRGYGHGVGMSQYGANGMANAGYNYEDILKHYYSNIEFSKI